MASACHDCSTMCWTLTNERYTISFLAYKEPAVLTFRIVFQSSVRTEQGLRDSLMWHVSLVDTYFYESDSESTIFSFV